MSSARDVQGWYAPGRNGGCCRTSSHLGRRCSSKRTCWIAAGIFETLVHNLWVLLRWLQGRADGPTAAILGRQTLQSTPESDDRTGYDGAKRRQGSRVHAAVDTLGNLLALHVSSADEQDQQHVGELAAAEHVELARFDAGDTGQTAADAAAAQGINLVVVKVSAAKRGFVLLPRRWVVERSFGWATRFRRLVRDDERLPETIAGCILSPVPA
jgi:transposase